MTYVIEGREYAQPELTFLRGKMIELRDKLLTSPFIGDTIYLSHVICVLHEMVKEADEVEGFVSPTCEGERCFCGAAAVKKIGEEVPFDDPHYGRHNLTAYVCADHYALLMGPAGARQVGLAVK